MESYFSDNNSFLGRFFFIFGQTKDRFCDSTLIDMDLDFALYKHLASLGYKRIIFYGKSQKLYFYDQESRRLTLDLQAKPKSAEKSPPILLKSPLKGKLTSAPRSNAKQSDETDDNVLHMGKLDETQAFMRINNCMLDNNAKTAVIFTNADDFMNHFGKEIRNEIYDSFNRYEGLGPDNYNIMAFIFPPGKPSDVKSRYKDTFFEQKMTSSNTININPPETGEIRNIINHYRLMEGLRVKFSQMEVICRRIAREYCASYHTLKESMVELGKITRENRVLNNEQCDIILGKKDKETALEMLDKLIGMESVKKEIRKLKKQAVKNDESVSSAEFRSRLLPMPVKPNGEKHNLHYVLTGNPGTGKTTAAKLLGEIYYELGYLDGGHTVKVTRADLVAGYKGQTALQTRKKIEEAIGGVLFIDEAYTLSKPGAGDDFGQEAIDTILEAMSDRNGEFAVVAAGYPEEMKTFVNSNPGFERRFKNVIHIDDYTPEELLEIFKMNLMRKNYEISAELTEIIGAFFENWHRSREKNWGNAGNVEKLIEQMYDNWCLRDGIKTETGTPILEVDDVPGELQIHCKPISESKKDASDKLSNLIGLKRVKERINELRRKIRIGGEANPGHYVFSGKPGTGKTTVARLLGDIFCDIGVLRRGHVVEVNREDLVGQYLGETAQKTKAKLEESLDGILFIDEAYSLYERGTSHNYGQESINTILAFMENNRGRVCVICAGYTGDMEKFLNSNTGLKSRFTETIHFDDYNTGELMEILAINAKNFILEEEYKEKSIKIFEEWTENKASNFANGRDVRTYFEESLDALYARLDREYPDIDSIPESAKKTLTGQDIPQKYTTDPEE